MSQSEQLRKEIESLIARFPELRVQVVEGDVRLSKTGEAHYISLFMPVVGGGSARRYGR